MQDLSVEALKVLIYPQVEAFFHRSCRSRVHPSNFIKKDSITEIILHWSCAVALFKLSINFLRNIFVKHFLTWSQASNLQVTTLLKITCKRLQLYSHVDSDACVNVDMPIARFPNGRFPRLEQPSLNRLKPTKYQSTVSLDFASFVWKRRRQLQR